MKMLKSFFLLTFFFAAVTINAQDISKNDSLTASNNTEVTYKMYKEMQKAYNEGEIDKATLQKAFNKMIEGLEKNCFEAPEVKKEPAKGVTYIGNGGTASLDKKLKSAKKAVVAAN